MTCTARAPFARRSPRPRRAGGRARVLQLPRRRRELRRDPEAASRRCTAAELVNEWNWVPHQTAFFRRDALFAVGLLDPRFELVQDWELWVRLAKQFPIRYVDDYWAAFRITRGQRSDVKKYTYWREARKMTRSHGGRFFSPLMRPHYVGKVTRAAAMLRRGQLRTFAAKLRDFALRR